MTTLQVGWEMTKSMVALTMISCSVKLVMIMFLAMVVTISLTLAWAMTMVTEVKEMTKSRVV